jgi:hypothetical protein
MFKAESVLGLIGSILATISAAVSFAGCMAVALCYDTLKPFLNEFLSHIKSPVHFGLLTAINNAMPNIIIIGAVIWFVFAAASFILGFIGTSMLNKDNKNGGVLLIVAGVLALISVCNFVPFVLFLVGGIMAVSKKQTA